MTISPTFRTVAVALREYIGDTYNLIAATDAVVSLLPAEPVERLADWEERLLTAPTHNGLVDMALLDHDTCGHMREGKKILAIKALRAYSGASLKEAKEAVEDPRVVNATGYESAYARSF